jgi:hypothetical protein
LIGLALLFIVIAFAITRMKREVLDGSRFGALRLAFTITILIYNISESIFDRLGGGLWFFLLLMMMMDSGTVPEGAVSQLPPRISDQAIRPNSGKWTAGRKSDLSNARRRYSPSTCGTMTRSGCSTA